jgi:hypothetical protein
MAGAGHGHGHGDEDDEGSFHEMLMRKTSTQMHCMQPLSRDGLAYPAASPCSVILRIL